MDEWKKDLGSLFSQKDSEKDKQRQMAELRRQKYLEMKREVVNFLLSTAIPAFIELKNELDKYGLKVSIIKELETEVQLNYAAIKIEEDAEESYNSKKFIYKIVSPDEVTVWIEIIYMEGELIKEDLRECSIISYEEDNIYSISSNNIIDSFIYYYKKYI